MDKEDVIKEGAVNYPVAEEANEPILNNEFVKNKVSTERNYGSTPDASQEANTVNACIDEQERKIFADTSISHFGVVKNQVDTNNRSGKKNSFVESTPSSSLANKDENDQVLTPSPRKLKSLNSGQERSEAELSDLTKKKTYCVKVDADVD
ncbi:hypothetical protein P3S68_009672 [Capsicum galapagoense]